MTAIDKKLAEAIAKLSEEEKEEVLEFVDSITDYNPDDKWNDPQFVAEMDAEYEYYKNGGKMVSPEEMEARVNAIFEKKKNGL